MRRSAGVRLGKGSPTYLRDAAVETARGIPVAELSVRMLPQGACHNGFETSSPGPRVCLGSVLECRRGPALPACEPLTHAKDGSLADLQILRLEGLVDPHWGIAPVAPGLEFHPEAELEALAQLLVLEQRKGGWQTAQWRTAEDALHADIRAVSQSPAECGVRRGELAVALRLSRAR